MKEAPQGWRPTFADEVPDMPQVCIHPYHPSLAHKHAGIGKAWFYKPAEEVQS